MANEKSPLDGVQEMSNTRFDMLRWCTSSRKRRIISMVVVVYVLLLLVAPNFRSWTTHNVNQFFCWFDGLFVTTTNSADTGTRSTDTGTTTTLVVKDSPTNVRAEPSTKADIVTSLSRGDKVYPLAEAKNGWIYVRLENGKVGHIKADLLRSP